MRWLLRRAFWMLCHLGKPWGGFRPHRIYYWLGRQGFKNYRLQDYSWCKDNFGYEFFVNPFYLIDIDIIAFGVYDTELHAFIDHHVRRGMICLDVGANIGSVTLHLAERVGSDGHVYAFEPAPSPRKRLLQHVSRNQLDNVTVCSIALSHTTGVTTIKCAETASVNQGFASLVHHDHPSLPISVEVHTQTLDDFVHEARLSKLDLIKIDIQGAEMSLLEGGRRTFATIKPDLVVEVSPSELAVTGKNSQDLVALIEELGYKCFRLQPSGLGERISAKAISKDFETSNLYCTCK